MCMELYEYRLRCRQLTLAEKQLLRDQEPYMTAMGLRWKEATRARPALFSSARAPHSRPQTGDRIRPLLSPAPLSTDANAMPTSNNGHANRNSSHSASSSNSSSSSTGSSGSSGSNGKIKSSNSSGSSNSSDAITTTTTSRSSTGLSKHPRGPVVSQRDIRQVAVIQSKPSRSESALRIDASEGKEDDEEDREVDPADDGYEVDDDRGEDCQGATGCHQHRAESELESDPDNDDSSSNSISGSSSDNSTSDTSSTGELRFTSSSSAPLRHRAQADSGSALPTARPALPTARPVVPTARIRSRETPMMSASPQRRPKVAKHDRTADVEL
jgi:hypothetical protein